MYLELHESIGKTGEVRFNPYSHTYNGTLEAVEEYLSMEPKFGKVKSAPEIGGAPEMAEITDERAKLQETARDLKHRGIWSAKIIDE